MVKTLYNAISTYYETLFQSGYISLGTVYGLLVLDFLTELMQDPDYFLMATPCEQGLANKIYKCVIENNCLVQ